MQPGDSRQMRQLPAYHQAGQPQDPLRVPPRHPSPCPQDRHRNRVPAAHPPLPVDAGPALAGRRQRPARQLAQDHQPVDGCGRHLSRHLHHQLRRPRDNIVELVDCVRTRWKIEYETSNFLILIDALHPRRSQPAHLHPPTVCKLTKVPLARHSPVHRIPKAPTRAPAQYHLLPGISLVGRSHIPPRHLSSPAASLARTPPGTLFQVQTRNPFNTKQSISSKPLKSELSVRDGPAGDAAANPLRAIAGPAGSGLSS